MLIQRAEVRDLAAGSRQDPAVGTDITMAWGGDSRVRERSGPDLLPLGRSGLVGERRWAGWGQFQVTDSAGLRATPRSKAKQVTLVAV